MPRLQPISLSGLGHEEQRVSTSSRAEWMHPTEGRLDRRNGHASCPVFNLVGIELPDLLEPDNGLGMTLMLRDVERGPQLKSADGCRYC